jgi:ATP-binding cassette subfamily B protein
MRSTCNTKDRPDDRSIRLKLHNILLLRQAAALVWESAPSWTAAAAGLVMLQGALPLVNLYLIKLIVDSVTAGVTSTDKEAAVWHILLLISLAGGAAILAAACRSASTVVSEAQSAIVSDHVQDLLHAKSVEVDLEYYENPQYYDALHQAQREAPYRPTKIVNGLLQLSQSSISLLAMIALLVSFSWVLGPVLVAAAIPGAFVRQRYIDRLYRWQCQCTQDERRAWYIHWILTGDGHAKEIRLFDLGPLFMKQYRELRRQLRLERLCLTARRSAAELVAQVFSVVAVFVSLGFIAIQAVWGVITLGSLVMYFGAFQQGQTFLSSLFTSLTGLYEDSLFLSSLQKFLDLEPNVREPDSPTPVPKPMKEGISFQGVSFSYPGSNTRVLDGVDIEMKPGQVVALVGENGSGKTTLIKLLCRLYDPVGGRIAIDGIDLGKFRTSDLRREISGIFQDYSRYNLTARENIWLGDVHLDPEDPRVVQSSERSGADEVISGLENGYQTVLGKWFDHGAELSVEWQKVALARAFLRDSQVIILDEPTSSLDARAEEKVFGKFRELAEGRTAILISHRLSTVRSADRIYFLMRGMVAESGTHEELMNLGGDYAKLFETQARHYR